jgi:hypothetical protein
MPTLTKTIRIVLIVLTIFLALSAFAGAIQLIEGTYAPPADLLAGSPFDSYLLPGLALGLIVGGSALFAAVLLIRKSRFALLASVAAGLIIMFFEFVEVLVIGSPAGPAFMLQVFYFGLGVVIAVVSLGQWFVELLAGAQTAPQFSA